jgi:hypothetical protein
MMSPNNMFSLRANVFGDLYILSKFNQVFWICNNSRSNKLKIYGAPILELTNYGEFTFVINDELLFVTKKISPSDNYKIHLTDSGELIIEYKKIFISSIDSYRKEIIKKNVKSIVYKAYNIYS